MRLFCLFNDHYKDSTSLKMSNLALSIDRIVIFGTVSNWESRALLIPQLKLDCQQDLQSDQKRTDGHVKTGASLNSEMM